MILGGLNGKFKKRGYKSNSKHFIYALYSLVICFCVIFLSNGFSAFSSNLSIKDISAIVRVNTDIRIKSITMKEASQDISLKYNEYNVKSTSTGVTLPNSDSYIILDIGIVNLGNVEMGIKSITGLNKGLKYEIFNNEYLSEGYNQYSLKNKLCDDIATNTCVLGAETQILLKISYENQEAYNNSESKTFDINLNYDFRRIYKITYQKKAQQLLTSAPVDYVIENDDFSVGFNFLDIDYVSVLSSYKLTQNVDYTLDNKILSVYDVKDNIIIGVNYDTYGDITISSKWISNNSV